jgi:hypothetical protein
MKHLIIAAIAVTVAIGAYAQEIMKPIVPKNTLQLYLDKAKVYSEAAAAEQKERIDELIQKINSLTARIKVVEATYQQKDGTVGIIAEPGQAVAVNDASADAYISGQVDQPATLLAKSVSIDNTQISITNMPSSGAGVLITSPTIDVVGSKLSGNTQKSSNLVMAQGTETMTVKDTTFTGQTYNTIMTGQRTTEYLKEFTIENCNFDEDCKHVNVWFAGFQDGATLTIKNCKFKTCVQFLCVSDFAGKTNKLNIVLENVTIESFQNDDQQKIYNGFMYFDDRVCASEVDFLESKPFANVTLTLKNVTAGGVKMTADTFKLGNAEIGQMCYMYCSKSNSVYPFNDETKVMWPKISVDGVVVNE